MTIQTKMLQVSLVSHQALSIVFYTIENIFKHVIP